MSVTCFAASGIGFTNWNVLDTGDTICCSSGILGSLHASWYSVSVELAFYKYGRANCTPPHHFMVAQVMHPASISRLSISRISYLLYLTNVSDWILEKNIRLCLLENPARVDPVCQAKLTPCSKIKMPLPHLVCTADGGSFCNYAVGWIMVALFIG